MRRVHRESQSLIATALESLKECFLTRLACAPQSATPRWSPSSLKSAGPKTQEQARLQVEEAEDKLVQTTETAIGLMKAVLENPEPIQNLNSLVKAQLIFHSTAAETLSVSVAKKAAQPIASEKEKERGLISFFVCRTFKARSRNLLRRQSPSTVRRGRHDEAEEKIGSKVFFFGDERLRGSFLLYGEYR